MSITIYQPAPLPAHEILREQYVVASGALAVRNDRILQALVEEAAVLLETSMAAVSIIYKDWQYVIAATGISPGAYSRRTSVCGHALATGDAIFHVGDMQADGRFAGNPAVIASQGLRFYAGALLAMEGAPALGTICVFDRQPRPTLSRADCEALRSLAGRVLKRLVALSPA